MLGAGTKTAITTARDFPAILDVTRLTSRVGRGPLTGVDRVEMAYLEWCLSTDPDLWGLAKASNGYAVLDRVGLEEFYKRLTGEVPWGKRDLRAVVGIKTPAPRGAAESDLRRLATARIHKISPYFKDFGPKGLRYLNIGHSNLRDEVLSGFSNAGISNVVFVHDVIPLDYPQFQTPDSVGSFRSKIELISEHADFIITNSADTLDRMKNYLVKSKAGRIYSHLGVDITFQSLNTFRRNRPYFVTLGTIEPRKNHALLLNVWDALEKEVDPDLIPNLHIVGERGWMSEDVITRLDYLKDSSRIYEHNGLPDTELWPLVSGAHGLLFPSFAEGFGLPSLEAAALGVPVICGDLAIHHELLGDYPVYAPLQDLYFWKKTIIEQAEKRLEDLRDACAPNMPHIPTWDEHFDRVNGAVMGRV